MHASAGPSHLACGRTSTIPSLKHPVVCKSLCSSSWGLRNAAQHVASRCNGRSWVALEAPTGSLLSSMPLFSSSPRRRMRLPAAPLAAVKTAEHTSASELPSSRDQSIQQAAEALSAQLPKEKKGKAKSMKVTSVKRFTIDIPVADQSPQASVELARELLKQLPKAASDSFTVIFGDGATADLAEGAGGLSNPVLRVNPNLPEPLAGPLLIVGAQNLQVADVQEMLFGWRGGFAAALNLEWDDDQADADLASFVKSWDCVYCFRPLDIQGFFSKREGCVFKFARRGSPTAAPWNILLRERGSDWQAVGRQQRKPSAGDLEVAFYNAAAASSPITKGVKFVKGITGGKK